MSLSSLNKAADSINVGHKNLELNMSIRQPSYNKERIDKYCIHTIAGCFEKENMRFAVVYENPTEVVNSNKI